MQSFMITFDFETYTNQYGDILPYSFAMFAHCIFNNNKKKNCLNIQVVMY